MKKATPDIKHGKEFERELHEQFNGLDTRYPIRWARIMDTAEAGNIVRNADADFKLTVKSDKPGAPWLFHIEAKASVREKPFGSIYKSLIKSSQNASMVMAVRAGASGCYVFKSLAYGCVEIWDALVVNENMGKPKRSKFEGLPAHICAFESLDRIATMMCCNPEFIAARLIASREGVVSNLA